ncbi:MAG: hypothetical protein PHN99_07305, partial [Eubacteriales bacterium]|nr:hypothetical protein [Eubacteriales bacterium]
NHYYDLQTVNVHVFDDDARALTISGVRVYASDDLATLFNADNLIYSVTGDLEPLKTFTLDTPKKVRYIALYLTETQSGWRPREFEAIGTLSEDQGDLEGNEDPTNILLGMPPSGAGVAITSDYFSIINGGGSGDYAIMLTDGIKSNQTVQLWGAKDRVGSKFVITYDLEQNYDISQIAAYVWPSADYQGVEAWDVYVSRYYDDLYNAENKYVGRRDFNDPAALKIPVVRETIRYISFVFTQPDYEVYGALRLFELEAFGVISATQEVPVEEEPYDPYVSIPHEETGVILKVAKVDEFDDYAFAGTFNVTRSTASDDLAGLAGLLDLRYTGLMIFNFEILDEYGDPADFGGRTVKIVLDIPADFLGDEIYLAVLDGENTELMNASIVNGQFVFFTSNVQSYAIVRANAAGDPGIEIPDETETSDPGSSPETSEAGSLVVMLLAAIAAGSITLFGMKKNYLKQ